MYLEQSLILSLKDYKESQVWRDQTKNSFDSTPESDLKFGLSNLATYDTNFK